MNEKANNSLNLSSFIWNTVGSTLSAGSSFILLSCVTQSVGANDSGIFAFAFSSAQLMLTLGKFGVRSYQVTDVTRKISTSTYFLYRMFSSFAMLLLCIGMIMLLGYTGVSASVIFAVCLLKMVDAVEDVCHGHLHLNCKLNVAGALLAARNFFTTVLFATMIFMTKNVNLTCWVTAISSLIMCLIINYPMVLKYDKIKFCWNKSELKLLILSCFPLFLGDFLTIYIYNAPKYSIEIYCTNEIQTFYNVIFMPSFAINLVSEFVFKPFLTSLAIWWNDQQYKKIFSLVIKMILFIFVATIVVILGAYFLGVPVLSFVFGIDITPYKTEFLILLLGGGVSAIVYFLYHVLTAMRKQKFILVNCILASVIITLLSFTMVKNSGITGAAIAYVCTEIILCFFMLVSVIYFLRKGIIRKKLKLKMSKS